MWTVKLVSTSQDANNGDIIVITLEYINSDGRTEQTVERISDFNSLKQIASNGVQMRTDRDAQQQAKIALLKNPPLGIIDLSSPDPTPTTPLTPDDIYQNAKDDLVQKKSDLDLGLITQVDYDNAVAKVLALQPQNVVQL